jgi:hypothetical protein
MVRRRNAARRPHSCRLVSALFLVLTPQARLFIFIVVSDNEGNERRYSMCVIFPPSLVVSFRRRACAHTRIDFPSTMSTIINGVDVAASSANFLIVVGTCYHPHRAVVDDVVVAVRGFLDFRTRRQRQQQRSNQLLVSASTTPQYPTWPW